MAIETFMSLAGGGPMPIPKASTSPYTGASRGRRAANWNASRLGPKTVQYANLETLRDRAYDAVRNNAYARNAVKTWKAEAIGTGIRPNSLHPVKKIRKQIDEAFAIWTEESEINARQSWYGQQCTGFGSIVQAGETFGRFVVNKRRMGQFIPLTVQLIEPDQMPTWFTDQSKGIRSGIEFDGDGRIVNYHFFKEHPYDVMYFPDAWERIQVPAADIVHSFQIDRPGQIRGEPWITAILTLLHEIESYDDTELARKKTCAMMAGFVHKQSPDDQTAGVEDTSTTGNKPGTADIDWEPASISVLLPGEEITFAQPPSDTAYEPYMVMQLNKAAAGIDLSYHQLSNDLRKANYSSLRAGLVAFRRKCEQYQYLMFVFQFCRPTFRRVITEAVIAGRLDLPGFDRNPYPYLRCEWVTPGWDWVDPLKDVQASLMEIKGGLSSRKFEVTSRGGKVEQIDLDNQEDQMRARKLGLLYDSDPALVLGRGETAGPDAPEDAADTANKDNE